MYKCSATLKMIKLLNFPGGPMVKMLRFHWRGHGFHPWLGKFHIPHSTTKRKDKLLSKNFLSFA